MTFVRISAHRKNGKWPVWKSEPPYNHILRGIFQIEDKRATRGGRKDGENEFYFHI
jgi:hypothetical protein